MAVITRWSYKRGGRKAGFHCSTINKEVVTHPVDNKIYLHGSGGSRPSDRGGGGGGGHPVPEISGRPGLTKIFSATA